ncbi:MAG: hypothetical protein H0X62_01735, partial [Bacteroidetes bacterium]|nr:hypothetical protein [Bacteroidota bacterium]
ILTGCAIRIIAPYDPITDAKVSDLQENVIVKFTEWERKIPPIQDEYKFYDHTDAVLEMLIARNKNIKKSEIVVQMLEKTQANVHIIKNLHQQNELSIAVIKEVKPDIMAQFNAIQAFLMALKKSERTN